LVFFFFFFLDRVSCTICPCCLGPRSSGSLPPESLGLQAWVIGAQHCWALSSSSPSHRGWRLYL
jgi:hypothetical protein